MQGRKICWQGEKEELFCQCSLFSNEVHGIVNDRGIKMRKTSHYHPTWKPKQSIAMRTSKKQDDKISISQKLASYRSHPYSVNNSRHERTK